MADRLTTVRVIVLHDERLDPTSLVLTGLSEHRLVRGVNLVDAKTRPAPIPRAPRVEREPRPPRIRRDGPATIHAHQHLHDVPHGDDHETIVHEHEHVHWSPADGHHGGGSRS